MKSSEYILQKMRDTETFVDHAYIASPGEPNYTIGYGHMGADVHKGQTITKPQAELLFKTDARKYESIVNSTFHVPLNQNQYDALVDFAFNLGGFSGAQTLRDKINKGDYAGGANAFLLYNQGSRHNVLDGLKIRRAFERTLFLQPVKKAPVTNYHNWKAIAEADAKKKADARGVKFQADLLRAKQEKQKLADAEAVKKAKLTKDKQAITKAEATKKANELKAKQAKDTLNKNAENLKKQNEANLKNAHGTIDKSKNTPATPKAGAIKTLPKSLGDLSKMKVSKSGINIIGLIVMVLLLANIKVPTTELE
jgi:lysozyme